MTSSTNLFLLLCHEKKQSLVVRQWARVPQSQPLQTVVKAMCGVWNEMRLNLSLVLLTSETIFEGTRVPVHSNKVLDDITLDFV
jgi:hypothetical protein